MPSKVKIDIKSDQGKATSKDKVSKVAASFAKVGYHAKSIRHVTIIKSYSKSGAAKGYQF